MPTLVDEYAERAATKRLELLEKLAAAYLLHTQLPPDRVELCEQNGSYFFRERIKSNADA